MIYFEQLFNLYTFLICLYAKIPQAQRVIDRKISEACYGRQLPSQEAACLRACCRLVGGRKHLLA